MSKGRTIDLQASCTDAGAESVKNYNYCCFHIIFTRRDNSTL